MKNIINIALAFVCVCFIFVIGNNGYKNEKVYLKPTTKDIVNQKEKFFEETLAIAKKEKKSVILIFGNSRCVWCQKYEYDTLQSTRVLSSLNKYLILKIDTDKQKYVAERYEISSIPTTVIINYDEVELKRKNGFMSVREFLNFIN